MVVTILLSVISAAIVEGESCGSARAPFIIFIHVPERGPFSVRAVHRIACYQASSPSPCRGRKERDLVNDAVVMGPEDQPLLAVPVSLHSAWRAGGGDSR